MYKGYTYLIGWKNLNTWYYGRRTANICPPVDDFWKKYKTSSEYVREFIANHGEPDYKKIRLTSFNKEIIIRCEERILKKFNCAKSDNWLNKTDNKNFFHHQKHSDKTKEKIRKKRKNQIITEETRKKISQKLKGRVFSDDHKRKISERSKIQRHSEETKQKMSEIAKHRKHSVETKEKMSSIRKGKPWSQKRRKTYVQQYQQNTS